MPEYELDTLASSLLMWKKRNNWNTVRYEITIEFQKCKKITKKVAFNNYSITITLKIQRVQVKLQNRDAYLHECSEPLF